MKSPVLLLVLCQVAAIFSQALDADRTKFTFEFLRQIHRDHPDENSILSPLAIHTVLSMMYPVADPGAAAEMRSVLGLAENSDQVESTIRELLGSSKNEALNMAFKMYHSKQNEIRRELLNTFRDRYQVPLEAVDFEQGQQVADSANAWVDRVTDSKIQNLYTADDFSPDDSMMLLNAITLNAEWKYMFFPDSTKKEVFHFENGDHEVDMMYNVAHLPYCETRGLRALELPYKSKTDLSMLIILPSEGTSLNQALETLNEQVYDEINNNMKIRYFDLFFPKFSITKKTKAKDILSTMGLKRVFQSGAFDASSKGPFMITGINQNARIDVNERGTVAAAVTEMRGILTSMPRTLRIDRPFVYLIRKQSTKEIIFIGHFSHFQ
ncbi:serpin B4-like [Uranotaenia lowii]|uniref:serpin B4-like n=1 Tax=Uranotaenia lowii TaxID=190385 RepID=UPI00247A60EC|nr:serpin B4-like [Uranotaenia lowii]